MTCAKDGVFEGRLEFADGNLETSDGMTGLLADESEGLDRV